MSENRPIGSPPHVSVVVEGGGEVAIEFPSEHTTVSCPVTKVGEGLFRLEAVPLGAESAGYRDVIEAEEVGEGRLRFIRVVERSGWQTYDFILYAHHIDSEDGQALLRELEAQGGHWERMFGGLLFICIPPSCDFDPVPWVAAFGTGG